MATHPIRYRQSYVEKDRCVRNSTAVKVPGVDIMQGFTLSKSEFESVFLQTAENMDVPTTSPTTSPQPPPNQPSRFGRSRKNHTRRHNPDPLTNSTTHNLPHPSPHQPSSTLQGRRATDTDLHTSKHTDLSSASLAATPTAPSSTTPPTNATSPFRQPPSKLPEPRILTAHDAADYADVCRKHAASLQRSMPPDYDGAGEFFEKACDARAKHGLFCSPDNADAHVEYAQNLSKRGLTPEAEYHLRSAADIYRMLNARMVRKYGDVLLYLAVVIDRQGRLAEAENFYRSALAVYRANKLSDDNVRVAIDSLSNNLRAQGRADEVDAIVRRHFLGALD